MEFSAAYLKCIYECKIKALAPSCIRVKFALKKKENSFKLMQRFLNDSICTYINNERG